MGSSVSIFQRFAAASAAFRSPDIMASDPAQSSGVSASGVQPWFTRLLGGGRTGSGQYVSPDSAMRVSAVYAATRIIAESMASMPIAVYEKKGDKRTKVDDHPISYLLNDAPNDNNTGFEYIEMGQAHMCLRGNCYSRIDVSGRGELLGLQPYHPDKVAPRYDKASKRFTYDIDGEVGVPASQVLHVRGFTLDGLLGVNPIELARESIGLAMAAEQVGAEAFAEGFVPPVVLEVAANADKPQRATYRKEWVELLRKRREGPPVISGGMKLHTLRVSMADLQFLETRKFSVIEIARLFRVPPHMLADMAAATYNNVEQFSIEFVKYTLAPWIRRWEKRFQMSLLSEADLARGLYIKFNVDGLLRGDTKSRWEGYKIGREIGGLNGNEIRAMEDRDPYEGGEIFLEPLNMVPAGTPRAVKPGASQ